ncbi:TRAP transporter small permease [uncultured Cohaesibacter sp.]|uniref:TRAP transporter small permease n=1 Tax=uncultured Cohaesibacter sp. TaxID=1002546 RepID=UPI0029C7A44B|nr:TRAP transporter small permease [uncultured Cohaesibacter sp.]
MFEKTRRVVDMLCLVILGLCGVTFVVMTAVIASLVITRNFFGFSWSWSEEITRFLMVWLIFLGAAVLVRRDDHIALDALPRALPERARTILMMAIRLPILGVLWLILQQGWIVMGLRASNHSPALGIPLSWVYAAIPVGSALMLLFAAFNTWRDIRQLIRHEV